MAIERAGKHSTRPLYRDARARVNREILAAAVAAARQPSSNIS